MARQAAHRRRQGRHGAEKPDGTRDTEPAEAPRAGVPMVARQVRRRDVDVLAWLRDEHENIQSEYEGFQTAGGDDRYFLANRILRRLELHNRIEEDVFYPAVERAVQHHADRKGAVAVRAALQEHRALKEQVSRIRQSHAYDDRLTVHIDGLMERVRRHAETEERELFPVAQALMGEAGLLRLRQDAREREAELSQRLAA